MSYLVRLNCPDGITWNWVYKTLKEAQESVKKELSESPHTEVTIYKEHEKVTAEVTVKFTPAEINWGDLIQEPEASPKLIKGQKYWVRINDKVDSAYWYSESAGIDFVCVYDGYMFMLQGNPWKTIAPEDCHNIYEYKEEGEANAS
jgi:hypothetical protein